ncbi:MAG: homoserine O-acetyltransferase [Rickettsiales bacterium]|nr:homoserine O-acetyltransferase [Rickettsiales bacterium]
MKVKSSFGPQYKEFEIGDIVFLAKEKPLKLMNGTEIENFPLAYQTYGNLNADKSNAILICHALTGDQYAASKHPVTEKEGWWNFLIGEGKSIDTKKFFVISSNIIGGCMGSFGPKEIDPKTSKPYGLNFPAITINDMVRAQNLLIEHFGIKKLHAVIGGSTGGMQALAWANLYPQKVKIIIPMATSYRHSPQNIAFHEVGRQAIMADPNWCEGKYFLEKKYPEKGLAVARMTAHITYLSEVALQRKFGRELQNKNNFSFSFDPDFQVESYLHHQGNSFVQRFDANSYLYITKAVDYFDLEKDYGGQLSKAFSDLAKNKEAKICLISFSDDWLFPPSEAKKLTHALIACGVNVSSMTIESNAGHDSFLIETSALKNTINGFINN